jgi:hypothetical protein
MKKRQKFHEEKNISDTGLGSLSLNPKINDINKNTG